jgi:2'-5' RNA ligase
LTVNVFLAALPGQDNRASLVQKMDRCEAKRSPLVKIHWTHAQDLHVTLGYIANVDPKDIRMIAVAMTSVAEAARFMTNFGAIKLYGSALVLCLEPYHSFFNIHKKMNQKLQESSQQKYHFETSKRYTPHITLGRIRNAQALNELHKQQFISLAEEQFRESPLLIQQAALMQRVGEGHGPIYQAVHLYPFRG